jgi:hypothetical protein
VAVTAKVQPAAGIQVRVRAEMAVNVVSVRLFSREAKAKRLSPLKAAATSTMMKAANRILIAKMQTVRLLPPVGRNVQEAIVRMAEIAEVVAAAAEGIVVEAQAVAAVRVAGAIAVLVVAVVEIAAIAK